MMLRTKCFHGLMLAATIMAASQVLAAADPSQVKVEGALGIARSLDNSCIAVWIAVPDNMAISGMKWYNNDGTIPFPQVLVQSGRPDNPVDLPDAVPVAENVFGESSDWSEVDFNQDVGSFSGGLYVIFRIPADMSTTARGAGGGPAIGYTLAGSGVPGWMSPDGQEWEPLHQAYGFAVQPVFVVGNGDLLLKSAGKIEGEGGDLPTDGNVPNPQIYPTTLHPAYPNPFNPQTELKFSLHESSQVDLAIYNVRGERVQDLVSAPYEPGEYSVVWDGRNRNGARLASGVYFARFVAGSIAMTQRLVLIQ